MSPMSRLAKKRQKSKMAASGYFDFFFFFTSNPIIKCDMSFFGGVEPTSGPQVTIIGHMKVKTWSCDHNPL